MSLMIGIKCRTGQLCLAYKNNLYISGGMNSDSCAISFKIFYVFNSQIGTWEKHFASGDIPEPRTGMQKSKGISNYNNQICSIDSYLLIKSLLKIFNIFKFFKI